MKVDDRSSIGADLKMGDEEVGEGDRARFLDIVLDGVLLMAVPKGLTIRERG